MVDNPLTGEIDPTDLAVAAALFLDTVGGLTEAELRAPSALPDWSRAHVAAHVVLNAEGFIAAAAGLRSGIVGLMYPDGIEQRSADIERLAAASRDELIDRLRSSDAAFVDAWDPAPNLDGECATTDGHPIFSASTVPQRRLRELQVHLLDLGLAAMTPDDWLDGFVDADLALQWPTVAHRTDRTVAVEDDQGAVWRTTPDAEATVYLSRGDLLAWVLDRSRPAELPTLTPWSNRSRWEHL